MIRAIGPRARIHKGSDGIGSLINHLASLAMAHLCT